MQCNYNHIITKDVREDPPPRDSVVGWLVAGVSLWLRDRGEGRLLVGYAAGIGGVGGRRVSRGGVGRRVGRVEIWRRLHVGGDGGCVISAAKTAHGKIGQDPLKMTKKNLKKRHYYSLVMFL